MADKSLPIENKIYASIIDICEVIERDGMIKGNGEQLALLLTHRVSVSLLPVKQRKIYDVLTRDPQTTADIANMVEMPINIVTTQLAQIQKKTLLIFSGLISKKKSWYKRSYLIK